MRRERRARWTTRVTTAAVAFTAGLALGTYEVVLGERNPAALAFATGLVGYPLAAGVDHARTRREGEDADAE